MVRGVFRTSAKSESSRLRFCCREPGVRVMVLGLLRRAAAQGMRRKGALLSLEVIVIVEHQERIQSGGGLMVYTMEIVWGAILIECSVAPQERCMCYRTSL